MAQAGATEVLEHKELLAWLAPTAQMAQAGATGVMEHKELPAWLALTAQSEFTEMAPLAR